ncbi:hypothetical protein [Chryseobacterium paludis]|uniref:hypothetical protein n=1 Tax=Chryseobacterium paludis TaxID=2956784 RepID=UPI0021C1D5C4|nr:hypothetical protein [Chryseobacterium paludis]
MKKLIFTSLLGLGLLLPANISATANSAVSKTEFSTKKPKKKYKKSRSTKSRKSSRTYAKSKGCMYNGNSLNVGPRGGCYYYSGSSKVYVDRSYCSGCN